MAIGMAIKAQRALGNMVPDVEETFERAGAMTINSSRIRLCELLFLRSYIGYRTPESEGG
jgi:hypothetical protein